MVGASEPAPGAPPLLATLDLPLTGCLDSHQHVPSAAELQVQWLAGRGGGVRERQGGQVVGG